MSAPNKMTKAEADVSYRQAQAERAMLKLEKERAAVISRTEHLAAMNTLCGQFRDAVGRVVGLSTSLAGRPASEIKQRLRDWANMEIDRAFGGPVE